MPFTLFHGLIPYFIASFFTKNKKYWLLAFAGGIMPDLDGIPILFDLDLYYKIHHEFFHPPIFGVALALPAAFFSNRFLGLKKFSSAIAFALGFVLHSITDVLFTDWPVKLLWPLSSQQFSYPIFVKYNFGLAFFLAAIFFIHLATIWKEDTNKLTQDNTKAGK